MSICTASLHTPHAPAAKPPGPVLVHAAAHSRLSVVLHLPHTRPLTCSPRLVLHGLSSPFAGAACVRRRTQDGALGGPLDTAPESLEQFRSPLKKFREEPIWWKVLYWLGLLFIYSSKNYLLGPKKTHLQCLAPCPALEYGVTRGLCPAHPAHTRVLQLSYRAREIFSKFLCSKATTPVNIDSQAQLADDILSAPHPDMFKEQQLQVTVPQFPTGTPRQGSLLVGERAREPATSRRGGVPTGVVWPEGAPCYPPGSRGAGCGGLSFV